MASISFIPACMLFCPACISASSCAIILALLCDEASLAERMSPTSSLKPCCMDCMAATDRPSISCKPLNCWPKVLSSLLIKAVSTSVSRLCTWLLWSPLAVFTAPAMASRGDFRLFSMAPPICWAST
ncbi:Uncharacterised protein [Acinetobacter baumannii]|nr:Uncharacterised protein [Acinetobacter baumannii]